MKVSHWVVIGMLLSGLSVNIASLHDWREALSPTGVAGILLTIGSVLTALFSDKVTK